MEVAYSVLFEHNTVKVLSINIVITLLKWKYC